LYDAKGRPANGNAPLTWRILDGKLLQAGYFAGSLVDQLVEFSG